MLALSDSEPCSQVYQLNGIPSIGGLGAGSSGTGLERGDVIKEVLAFFPAIQGREAYFASLGQAITHSVFDNAHSLG